MAQGSTWQQALTCFSPNFVTHTVGEQELHFYSVSVGLAFKMKVIGRPMARSLSVLFSKNDSDLGTKDISMPNEHGTEDREITISPLSEGMAKIRSDQKADAIEGLVEALTNDANAAVVGEVIMDSLAEIFLKDKRNEWPPPLEFFHTMPLPIVGEMIMGVVQANKKVFGPLTDQVADAVRATVGRVTAPASAEAAAPEVAGTIPVVQTSG